jgi:kinesin family protein 15
VNTFFFKNQATIYINFCYLFYHLQDELVRTKSGENTTCETGYFNAQNARASLHSLRVSLNRSLILPHIEVESEDEMDVDEEDVHELRDQISKLHSSSEDTLDDFMDAESGEDSPCSKGNPKICEHDDQFNIDDSEGALQEEVQKVYSNMDADQDKVSDRKSSLSISAFPQLGPMQDPTFCSSPKIHKARKSITSPGFSPSKLSELSPGDTTTEMSRKSAVRSSLQSSKLSPTDSLAASLQRGLHIIEYHQQNPSPRKSFVGLSFDHFALNPRQSAKASSALQSLPEEHVGSVSTICSSCKKALGTNDDHSDSEVINSGKQIVMATGITSNDLDNASRQVCYFVGTIYACHVLPSTYTLYSNRMEPSL